MISMMALCRDPMDSGCEHVSTLYKHEICMFDEIDFFGLCRKENQLFSQEEKLTLDTIFYLTQWPNSFGSQLYKSLY